MLSSGVGTISGQKSGTSMSSSPVVDMLNNITLLPAFCIYIIVPMLGKACSSSDDPSSSSEVPSSSEVQLITISHVCDYYKLQRKVSNLGCVCVICWIFFGERHCKA